MPNVHSNISNNEICAFFKNRSEALAAISDLKDAGFSPGQIGLAVADDPSLTSTESVRTEGASSSTEGARGLASRGKTDDRSAWDKIKDFFAGEHETYIGDERAHESTYGNISSERARYYNSGIAAGGAVLTVSAPADRLEEAREILADHDADVRTSGFETGGVPSSDSSTGAGTSVADTNERRIQLRGEMLRAVKQRVEKARFASVKISSQKTRRSLFLLREKKWWWNGFRQGKQSLYPEALVRKAKSVCLYRKKGSAW